MIQVMTKYQLDTCSITKTGQEFLLCFLGFRIRVFHQASYSMAFGLEKRVKKKTEADKFQ
jgi:hypothetical protein